MLRYFISHFNTITRPITGAHGWLRHYATSQKVASSSPDEVDFFQLT
jgi:hypothetical protein